VAVTIGRARVTILFEATFSIKEKRGEIASVTKKVRTRFNAAIAEIETLDDMRTGTIGVVVVSNDASHAQAMLANVVEFIERSLDLAYLGEVETELFPFDG
jgi:uncharacterized protein YlxP (DUF503 family)